MYFNCDRVVTLLVLHLTCKLSHFTMELNVTAFPTTLIYEDNVTLEDENDVKVLAKSYMMYKVGK